jgi:hypothetical protein
MMNTVPVKLPDMYEGLASCHGLIRDEGDQLSLEFQVQDGVLGVFKSGIRQVSIPLAELASVSLQRTWFGLCNRLVIQVAHMDRVKDVPGMTQGRITLGIARKDREAARQFVDDLHVPERA